MAELKLIHISVAVTANDHNPTVLNPDFLARNDIVPDGWQWSLSETPITTPPYSSVRYDSGVSLIVEPTKLLVLDTETQVPVDSKVVDIAKEYIGQLPHVRYTAVGVNFHALVMVSDATEYIKTKFLNPAIGQADGLETIGIKLVYSVEGAQFVLEFNPVTTPVAVEGKEETAILIKGNFHIQCTDDYCSENLLKEFPDIGLYWDKYQEIVNKVMDD